jgi:hypothetical protein
MMHLGVGSVAVLHFRVLSSVYLLFSDFSVEFEVADQLVIIYSSFVKYWRKEWEYTGAVHQLFIAFWKAYHSVRRKV